MIQSQQVRDVHLVFNLVLSSLCGNSEQLFVPDGQRSYIRIEPSHPTHPITMKARFHLCENCLPLAGAAPSSSRTQCDLWVPREIRGDFFAQPYIYTRKYKEYNPTSMLYSVQQRRGLATRGRIHSRREYYTIYTILLFGCVAKPN